MKHIELLGYSSNLNLVELVWDLVKAGYLRNKYFPGFTLFTDPSMSSLTRWMKQTWNI